MEIEVYYGDLTQRVRVSLEDRNSGFSVGLCVEEARDLATKLVAAANEADAAAVKLAARRAA